MLDSYRTHNGFPRGQWYRDGELTPVQIADGGGRQVRPLQPPDGIEEFIAGEAMAAALNRREIRHQNRVWQSSFDAGDNLQPHDECELTQPESDGYMDGNQAFKSEAGGHFVNVVGAGAPSQLADSRPGRMVRRLEDTGGDYLTESGVYESDVLAGLRHGNGNIVIA